MRFLLVFFLLAGTPFWPFDADLLPGDPLIIINKKTNELAWIDGGKIQMRTKVATGKTKDLTPEGLFTVKVKAVQPYYRKKDIPGGDPRNPLGSRWIGFDAKGTDGRIYGLHGTNQPDSIGKYVSEGCIRLSQIPLESLYEAVPEGTKILITHTDLTFEQLASEAGAL
ncbi:L,D-transpeptidase [Siminovitchia sediminis]|uniref:L,D-transpeptidase n=1 Tax=Siminovitchia sediminis TaxID=1274353 RepID=A0ABW4KGH0_9BACI